MTPAELPRVRRLFIDGPFGQVHCRVAEPAMATRQPIVCLHMSPKSGRSYADVMPYLAAERAVIAPDNPGHGESDLPPADPPVSIEDYARSTWAAIDALVALPVHLVGYHTGSMVAVEAAAQRPADVSSIVNISAPVFTREEQQELMETYAPVPIDEAGTRFRTGWQRVVAHRGPGVTLQMLADSFAENLRAGDAYEWGHRAAFAYASTYNERLGSITHPLLILNPADDCHEQTKRADALLPEAHRIDFPDWGHGFLNAYPDAAAEVILDFVNAAESNG